MDAASHAENTNQPSTDACSDHSTGPACHHHDLLEAALSTLTRYSVELAQVKEASASASTSSSTRRRRSGLGFVSTPGAQFTVFAYRHHTHPDHHHNVHSVPDTFLEHDPHLHTPTELAPTPPVMSTLPSHSVNSTHRDNTHSPPYTSKPQSSLSGPSATSTAPDVPNELVPPPHGPDGRASEFSEHPSCTQRQRCATEPVLTFPRRGTARPPYLDDHISTTRNNRCSEFSEEELFCSDERRLRRRVVYRRQVCPGLLPTNSLNSSFPDQTNPQHRADTLGREESLNISETTITSTCTTPSSSRTRPSLYPRSNLHRSETTTTSTLSGKGYHNSLDPPFVTATVAYSPDHLVDMTSCSISSSLHESPPPSAEGEHILMEPTSSKSTFSYAVPPHATKNHLESDAFVLACQRSFTDWPSLQYQAQSASPENQKRDPKPLSKSALDANVVGSSRSVLSSGSLSASSTRPLKQMTGTPARLQSIARVGTLVRRTRFLRMFYSDISCHDRNRGLCLWAESIIGASVRSIPKQKRIAVRFLSGRSVVLHFGTVDVTEVWSAAFAKASPG